MHRNSNCFTIIGLLLVPALPAYAYLDPASGSMLLQLIAGGLAGIGLAFKLYWHKILGFLGRKKNDSDDAI